MFALGLGVVQSMDQMIPALKPSAEIEKLNESANNSARKAIRLPQTPWYFDGVPRVVVA